MGLTAAHHEAAATQVSWCASRGLIALGHSIVAEKDSSGVGNTVLRQSALAERRLRHLGIDASHSNRTGMYILARARGNTHRGTRLRAVMFALQSACITVRVHETYERGGILFVRPPPSVLCTLYVAMCNLV